MNPADGTPDPSLVLPAPPDLGALGSIDFPNLQGPDPAPAVPGRDARIDLHPDGLSLAVGGVAVLDRLRVSDTEAGPPRVTPLGMERTLEAGTDVMVERAVVPLAGAAGFFEWTGDGGHRPRLEWRVPVGPEAAAGARWRATDRALVIALGERRLLFAASIPGSFTVAPHDDGVRVRYSAEGPGPVLLAATAAPAGGEARAARLLGRSGIAVRARESGVRRLLEERLAVDAPTDGPDPGLPWALIALTTHAPEPGAPGWAEAAVAEAALATGEAGSAKAMIRDAFAAGTPGAPALALLVRYLAWTGDRSTVSSVWERAMAAAEGLAGPDGLEGRGAGQPVRHILAGLAAAARDIGARGPERVGPTQAGPPDPAGTGAGIVDWLLDRVREAPGPVEEAAARVLRLALDLGVVPDAPRGRLTLRPRIPDGETQLRVRNLSVGGCAVALMAERDGAVYRFTLEQTRGAPPLQVVFEPIVAGPAARVAVDGVPAELTSERGDGSWRVPVQLVLDRRRVVDLEIGPGGG